MSYQLSEILALDPATADWGDLLAACQIVADTWPKQGVTPEDNAKALLKRQAAGEFIAGDTQWYVIRELSSGRFVAHANCFPRPITIDGAPHTILALGGVCTRPEYRKHGLGSAVVKACFARVDRGQFPWCLFQTSHKNRPFYEHLGAALVSNRFVNSLGEDRQANPFWDEIAMSYPASRQFPHGTVDLLGPGY